MPSHSPNAPHFRWQRSTIFLLIVVLLAILEPAMAQITPVCDRTPEVRDEIVKLVPGVSNCADVTEA